jgi:epoxyqueuosine reductase
MPEKMSFDLARDQAGLSLRIKEAGQRLGFDLIGISPVKPPRHGNSFAEWLRTGLSGELHYMERTQALRQNPRELLPWAVSVVSAGMNYYKLSDRPRPDGTPVGWISRYAWGDDYHHVVHERLESLLDSIRNFCGTSVEGRAFVDSGPVLEREFAGMAGIGWIGKNTHLISPRKGSWFFLGELFLSIPLAYDRPIRDRCGSCDLCLKACPTSAFVGPYVLDARRCISYLTIELKGWIPRHLRPLMGNHIFGCDICQEVCPYNVKAMPSQESAFAPREGLYAPQLVPLLSMTAAEFRHRFRGSPILRAKRRGFLRNIAVALGNLRSFEAVPALIGALEDDEALVRGHVAWALGRIGSSEGLEALRRRLLVEIDVDVRSEILEALEDAACPRSSNTSSSAGG